jgi:hypothetical protein
MNRNEFSAEGLVLMANRMLFKIHWVILVFDVKTESTNYTFRCGCL